MKITKPAELPKGKQFDNIKRQVIRLFDLDRRFKAEEEIYKGERTKLITAIKNFMYTNKGKTREGFCFEVTQASEKVHLNVKHVTPTKIEWYCDKLREKLDADIAKQIIDKTYTINDIDGLAKYLKKCGVSYKQFRKFISITEKANEAQIKQLNEIGEIQDEDLRGCYTTKRISDYLKISVSKIEEDDDEWEVED